MLGSLRSGGEFVAPEVEARLEMVLDLQVVKHVKEALHAAASKYTTMNVLCIHEMLCLYKLLGLLLAT